MLNDLLVAFGVRAVVVSRLWQKRSPKTSQSNGQNPASPNTSHLSMIHLTLNLYKRQLLPGEKLDQISETLLRYIDNSLRWEDVSSQHGLALSGQAKGVSLKDFCAEVLVDAITRTFFGDRIYDAEPQLIPNFLNFNNDAWMLIFHYPQSAASSLKKAQRRILKAFVNYIQSPEEVRTGQAWMIENVMEELKSIDINDEDRAALLLMIYWA